MYNTPLASWFQTWAGKFQTENMFRINYRNTDCTGKSFSEVLILASTNPQYDKRLSIELPVQYMKIPSFEHGENMRRTWCLQKLFFVFVLTFRTTYVHNMFYPCSLNDLCLELSCKYWTGNSMNNLLSYCGLVDAKIRASDRDLPVQVH